MLARFHPFKCPALAVCGTLLLSVPGLAALPPHPETQLPQLRSILESAKDRAPRLIEEAFLREEADARLLQAKADYYPRLDLRSNFGYRKDFRQGGAEDTDNFGLTYSAVLSRPLYHWGAIEARIEQARIDNDSEAIKYLENTRQIYRGLRSDYLTILLNQASIEAEQLQREIIQQELQRLRGELESGNISEQTFRATELDLQASLLNIQRLEREQQRIIGSFKTYAGWSNSLNIQSFVPESDSQELRTWLAAQRSALDIAAWTEQTTEASLIRNQIARQNEELKVIQSRQRPLLNFTASASQDQSNTSTQNNVDTFSIFGGFSVNWNIFDGFRTKHEKIEARLKIRRLEASLDRIASDLVAERTRMLDQIEFQADQTEVARLRYALEETNFANSRDAAQTGRLSPSQLKAAELTLARRKLELMSARASLLMHVSDYHDLTQPAAMALN